MKRDEHSVNASETATTSVRKRYYTERELSLYSGIAVRTLQSWRLRQGGPPWKRLGGAVRYDIAAFDASVAVQPGGNVRSA